MIAVVEPKQNEISVIAHNIDTGLQAFEKRKSELTELKEQATGLNITSIDDKDSINKVSTIRKKLKSARVEIEKEGKSMRDPLTRFSKLISEKEKELVAIIEPTEKELLVQEKWVDDEKEKIKKAAIDARMEKLSFSGIAFDPVYIGSLDDTTFNLILNNTKLEYEKDQAAKAEAERLANEEAARLMAEREELEKLRAEQVKAQAIIEENNERIRKEQEAKLEAIIAEQQKLSDEKKAAEMERQRIEQEKQRAIELEQERLLERQRTAGKARFEMLSQIDITNEAAVNLGALSDENWNTMYEAYRKSWDNKQQELFVAKMKVEKEAKEAALEREAALRPDKEKLESFAARIGSLIDFEVSDEKAQHILGDIQVMIGKIQTHILSKIKEL